MALITVTFLMALTAVMSVTFAGIHSGLDVHSVNVISDDLHTESMISLPTHACCVCGFHLSLMTVVSVVLMISLMTLKSSVCLMTYCR
jgi:hypothetical protein